MSDEGSLQPARVASEMDSSEPKTPRREMVTTVVVRMGSDPGVAV